MDGKLSFPTAEEAAYPWLFCERVVHLVEKIAIESGCTVLANLQEQVQARHLTTFQRYVFDALPRAAMLRPIVAEFGRYVTLGVNPQNPEFVNNLLKRMPKGSKVISRQLLPWDMFRVEMVDKLELDSWSEKGCESPVNDQKAVVELCKFGVPSDPQTFVTRAVKAGHPKDLMGQISDLLQETVLSNFHRPPHLLAKERIAFVKKYSDLANQLKAEELKLRYMMPDHIKELMRGKRLALWAKMLADLNYPDEGLIKDMVEGFPLTGWMPSSGVFPHGVRQPTLTVEALLASLASFNAKVKQQMDVRQEEALEQDTWAETLKELDKGWIWKDSSQSWEGKCVARRFGIHQGGKTRVIDDCSVCGLNQTVGLKEKFVLQAVDQMCTILCWSLQQAQPGEHPPIVGRTFDLKSAYKQFGLRKSDRDLLRIAVVDATNGKPMLCGLNALPFGGVGSVAGFSRVSLATWFTGMAGLKLCWTGYFDDFSTITRPELQNNTAWAVDSLFSLIGLDYAREGAKAPEFSTTFKMLGVQVDASKAQQHEVSVGHTVERKLELGQAFDDALTAGKLSTKLAERLRGRMVFYECFAAGRTTNLLLKKFGSLCRSQRFIEDLTSEECELILALKQRVSSAEPIVISPKFMETWFVFTDGACETNDFGKKEGGVGGVLISANGTYVQHFGMQMPAGWMEVLMSYSSHPVHEVEVLPVLISFCVWSDFLRGSQVLHYTDNDSCRFALMKGVGETLVARHFIASIMDREYALQTKSWYGRVPSYSNPAEDPSRGSSENLVAKGSQMVDIPWGELLSCLPSPNGGEDGESRQKPRGLKKGVPPFQHVCLFDFDFQYGHVVV